MGVSVWDAGRDGVREHFKEENSGCKESEKGERGVKAKELA